MAGESETPVEILLSVTPWAFRLLLDLREGLTYRAIALRHQRNPQTVERTFERPMHEAALGTTAPRAKLVPRTCRLATVKHRLLLLVLATAVVVAGCSSSSPPRNATTPTSLPTTSASGPTAIVDVTATPAELRPSCLTLSDPCAFALSVGELVRSADIVGITSLMRARDVDCPGSPAGGLGAPAPLCDGTRPGERRKGYSVGNESASFLYSQDQLHSLALFRPAQVRHVDSFGDGDYRLFTIGCPLTAPTPPECVRSFVFVLSGVPLELGRTMFLFFVEQGPHQGQFIIDSIEADGLLDANHAEPLTGGIPLSPYPPRIRLFRYFFAR